MTDEQNEPIRRQRRLIWRTLDVETNPTELPTEPKKLPKDKKRQERDSWPRCPKCGQRHNPNKIAGQGSMSTKEQASVDADLATSSEKGSSESPPIDSITASPGESPSEE